MIGRDPHEPHRAATALELLFDLTVVVAFSQASAQAAELLAAGRTGSGVLAFALAVFAVSWAWINFSWLSSAYDTDDVFFRIATFVEMLGVVVMALGLPAFFHSLAAGEHIDNAVMVAGYVIMRLATITLWLRAATHDPARRRACLTYAVGVSIVQLGWIAVIVADLSAAVGMPLMFALVVAELLVPAIAERHDGGTPWHPHHIAERYATLAIITLGEVVLGTVLAISAVVHTQGWSVPAVTIAVGGLLLAFGLWWAYFTVPFAQLLQRRRDRAFAFGYLHLVVFGAIAAVGAGLQTAAAVLAGTAVIGDTAVLLSVAVPVVLVLIMLVVLFDLLVGAGDLLHPLMLAGAIAVAGLAVVASLAGAGLGATIPLLACSPLVMVAVYEAGGHRRMRALLDRVDDEVG